jgi:hypothetical protein
MPMKKKRPFIAAVQLDGGKNVNCNRPLVRRDWR